MTPEATLVCDQAIFTSIRGPIGAGYRIVAAGRGLRSEERQAITRLSPSHDALCWQPGGEGEAAPYAVAFYTLPTGRLCVAYSCYAGAEHTARGGHRVYTHNVIFHERSFPACGFNPFRVIRAMAAAGLTVPDLTPRAVLPELYLPIDSGDPPSLGPFPPSLDSPRRCCALQLLFDDRALIVTTQAGWAEYAEALLMGIPGPMRTRISFGAGLRFSLSRYHRLHLVRDEKGVARSRTIGQNVEYLDPRATPPNVPTSAWLAFVDRLWTRADYAVLARRTSRPFTDFTPAARKRIGTLYNAMDAVPQTPSVDLLSLAAEHLRAKTTDVEDDVRLELLAEIRQSLLRRLANIGGADAEPVWPKLVALWRRIDAAFAQPLIEATLRSLMGQSPLLAAETALDVASDIPPGLDKDRHGRLLDEVLDRLASNLPSDVDPERLATVCTRWQFVRPGRHDLRALLESRSVVHSVARTSD